MIATVDVTNNVSHSEACKMKTFAINAAVISLAACTLCVRAVSQQRLGAPTKDAGSVEIPFPERVEHFVSGSRIIHYSGPSERIQLRIVVTPEGNVQSATPEVEKPKWRDQAISLAKTWRYIPFQRDGKPVLATFSEGVNIVPPERRVISIPFIGTDEDGQMSVSGPAEFWVIGTAWSGAGRSTVNQRFAH